VNDNLVFGLRFGILAICAVVGIYYALVRKPRVQETASD
jgi:hypothetical protein